MEKYKEHLESWKTDYDEFKDNLENRKSYTGHRWLIGNRW